MMGPATDGDIRLSVILPTHNGMEHILEQLEALAQQSWDRGWEIVFLDNGSTDGTNAFLADWVDRMPVPARLVRAADQLSLVYARNSGVEAAMGRSVAFCDDDDVIAPGWVAAMGETLENHAFVASRFDYTLLNDPVTASARGSFQTQELGEFLGVAIASGGGSGCHRSLWLELGGNDISFFRSGEDIDFSLRVAQHGTLPVFCGGAVYHVRLRGGVRSSFKQARAFAEASVALYRVHGPTLGGRRESALRSVQRWLGLVVRATGMLDESARLKWVWQLGFRVGRLTGSAKERTWYP